MKQKAKGTNKVLNDLENKVALLEKISTKDTVDWIQFSNFRSEFVLRWASLEDEHIPQDIIKELWSRFMHICGMCFAKRDSIEKNILQECVSIDMSVQSMACSINQLDDLCRRVQLNDIPFLNVSAVRQDEYAALLKKHSIIDDILTKACLLRNTLYKSANLIWYRAGRKLIAEVFNIMHAATRYLEELANMAYSMIKTDLADFISASAIRDGGTSEQKSVRQQTVAAFYSMLAMLPIEQSHWLHCKDELDQCAKLLNQ